MNKKYFIIGGVVVVGVLGYLLVTRKATLGNTGPSYTPPASLPPDPANPTAGKQVYAKSGTTIRTSPEVSDGFLGLFGNLYSNTMAGNWLGTIKATVPQAGGGNYKWYEISIAPDFTVVGHVSSTGKYYVREDYVTVK